MLDRPWQAWRAVLITIVVPAGCGGDDGAQPIDAAGVDAAVDARIVDAAVDATPIDADVGACSVDGVYTVDLGKPIFFGFDAETHVWGAALTEAELTTPLIDGTYTYGEGSFTIVESPDSACPSDQVGKYTVAFAAGCHFTLTLVDDPCTERAQSLGGAMFMLVHP